MTNNSEIPGLPIGKIDQLRRELLVADDRSLVEIVKTTEFQQAKEETKAIVSDIASACMKLFNARLKQEEINNSDIQNAEVDSMISPDYLSAKAKETINKLKNNSNVEVVLKDEFFNTQAIYPSGTVFKNGEADNPPISLSVKYGETTVKIDFDEANNEWKGIAVDVSNRDGTRDAYSMSKKGDEEISASFCRNQSDGSNIYFYTNMGDKYEVYYHSKPNDVRVYYGPDGKQTEANGAIPLADNFKFTPLPLLQKLTALFKNTLNTLSPLK